MRANNILGEVDYWLAERYGFVGGPGRCYQMSDAEWARMMGIE